MVPLTLAHSPDPDDAFMWWPLTGKIHPDGRVMEGSDAHPRISTSGFSFVAVPEDIEVLNRRAVALGDLDITALSFRTWLDVQHRYRVTRCGSSFGVGYGPKLISQPRFEQISDLWAAPRRIAIPGLGTTAFLLLNLLAQEIDSRTGRRIAMEFVPMPFDQVIGAVVRGEVDAGLVIHEGQLLYKDAGLRLLLDVGEWWLEQSGLPTPLGCNALRSDLDMRYGPGTIAEIAKLLRHSVDYALANRAESIAYTMPFALANAAKKGAESSGHPTIERVDAYLSMYVNTWTLDMGDSGIASVRRLYGEGFLAGLCPALEAFEPV